MSKFSQQMVRTCSFDPDSTKCKDLSRIWYRTHSRPPKGLRCKDIDPERHREIQAKHNKGKKYLRYGLTGKQARKARKRFNRIRREMNNGHRTNTANQ